MAAHAIENTGTEDVVFLEMFKAPKYEDISFNEWIARMPDKMAQSHLKLPLSAIRRAPQTEAVVLPQ
jgi:oxalate decarboxylase